MTLTGTGRDLLDDELLADFDGRAPVYDRHNTFFTEDFEELRRRGYLLASVPEASGGAGLNLAEINRLHGRALTARYQAWSTAAGPIPVSVPQSSSTTVGPSKPTLATFRSP